MTAALTLAQKHADKFYFQHGPCCAGCDHWQLVNSCVGLCLKSKIVPGHERASMLGIHGCSLDVGAGHAMTQCDHVCAHFSDAFDWSTLPLHYLREIGFPLMGDRK